jgi:hypothetical protein
MLLKSFLIYNPNSIEPARVRDGLREHRRSAARPELPGEIRRRKSGRLNRKRTAQSRSVCARPAGDG